MSTLEPGTQRDAGLSLSSDTSDTLTSFSTSGPRRRAMPAPDHVMVGELISHGRGATRSRWYLSMYCDQLPEQADVTPDCESNLAKSGRQGSTSQARVFRPSPVRPAQY